MFKRLSIKGIKRDGNATTVVFDNKTGEILLESDIFECIAYINRANMVFNLAKLPTFH